MIEIACIVEGQGEVEALPILIRRFAQERLTEPIYNLCLYKPIRLKADKILFWKDHAKRAAYLKQEVDMAAKIMQRRGGILVLLDLDDGCPAQMAPFLLQEFQAAAGNVPCRLIFASREYETWFLAAAESLQGCRGLPKDIKCPTDFENIRAAKGWLERQMGRPYVERLDQPALTAQFSFEQALRVDSFAKFCKDLEWLLTELRFRSQSA
jgi:hypothetical protein